MSPTLIFSGSGGFFCSCANAAPTSASAVDRSVTIVSLRIRPPSFGNPYTAIQSAIICGPEEPLQDFYEPKVGAVAPDFRLPSTRGKEHTLKELRGWDVNLFLYSNDHKPGLTPQAYATLVY